MRRLSPNGTSLTRNWQDVAAKAVLETSAAPHGLKKIRIASLAEDAGVSPILIRRAISARLSLMRLAEGGLEIPDHLWTAPVGIVDTVTKWAARDPAAALAAAKDYSDGAITFRALQQAERASRPAESSVRRPRTSARFLSWREDLIRRFERTLATHHRIDRPSVGDLPVHGWLSTPEGAREGLIVLGPHEHEQSYITDRPRICTLAAGLLRFGCPAILIAPSDAIRDSYRGWLLERAIARREIRVESVMPFRPMRGQNTGAES